MKVFGKKSVSTLGSLLSIALFKRNIQFLGSLCLFIYAFYLVWICLGPEKNFPNEERQQIANNAIQNMVEDIRNKRQHLRKVAVLHFSNDPTDYVTDTLRDTLNGTGILNLSDISISEKISKKLHLRCKEYFTTDEALDAISGLDVQGVLWGKVDLFETEENGAVIKGEWYLDEKGSGKRIASGVFYKNTAEEAKKAEELRQQELKELESKTENTEDGKHPWYVRFLVFLLLTLLLPIFTIAFIRAMVAKRSNLINAFVLGTYTFIDGILAFFMIGGVFQSGTKLMWFCLATFTAFCYNVCLMNFALKLEKE